MEMLRTCDEAGAPTIVYANRIATLEELLSCAEAEGISCNMYHGRLTKEARNFNQQLFFNEKIRVLFATKAFGMGINKANIRNVIHFDAPDSLEAYWQEAGRAGRDGQEADCSLLYCPIDSLNLMHSLRRSYVNSEFLERVYGWIAARAPKDGSSEFPFNVRGFIIPISNGKEDYETKLVAAIGALQEHGLIELYAGKVVLLKDRSTWINGAFPIGENILQARLSAKMLSLNIMEHYINCSNPRTVLLNHFRHNSVVQELDLVRQSSSTFLNEEQMRSIVFCASLDNPSTLELLHALTSSKSKRYPGELTEAVSKLLRIELESAIELLQSDGYLHKIDIEGTSYLVPTPKGLALLNEEQHQAIAVQSVEGLKKRIYNPQQKEVLTSTIRPFFLSEVEGLSSPDDWKYLIKGFGSEKFTVFGKTLTGAQLATIFHKLDQKEATDPEAIFSAMKSLLNFLFENIVDQDLATTTRWLAIETKLSG
jgi:hypothetical protein